MGFSLWLEMNILCALAFVRVSEDEERDPELPNESIWTSSTNRYSICLLNWVKILGETASRQPTQFRFQFKIPNNSINKRNHPHWFVD